LDVENLKTRITDHLYSDFNIKFIAMASILFGLVFIWLGLQGPNTLGYHFYTALGVSLVIGTAFGFWSGWKLGWPMGLLAGLILGLILSPLVSARLKGTLAAYFATFIGPIVGGSIGRWTELKDKKIIEKNIMAKRKRESLKTLNKKE